MNALIFDKTGTLTEGRPAVSDMHIFSSAPLAEVLHLALAAEVHSEHPLGQAMVHYAAEALGVGLSGGDCYTFNLPCQSTLYAANMWYSVVQLNTCCCCHQFYHVKSLHN